MDLKQEKCKQMKVMGDISLSEDGEFSSRTPGDKLCQDELSLIFFENIISTKDLLNFRGVNRSWRDAATSVLLHRDACHVKLQSKIAYKESEYTNYGVHNPVKWFFTKLGDTESNFDELGDLTKLVSNSIKFPSSNFQICTSGRRYFASNYANYSDLLLFFKLHGDKIRTLAPQGYVSQENLRMILCTYTPKLKCLDLTNSVLISSSQTFEKQGNTFAWTSQVLPFKSLIIPNNNGDEDEDDDDGPDEVKASYSKIMHLLLSSPSKLNCIKNVNLNAVPHILKAGKGHLIRGFELVLTTFSSQLDIPLLKQLADSNPRLFKLTFESTATSVCIGTLTIINQLLELSMDTLEQLELTLCPSDYNTKLKICPMKKLKSISLGGTYRALPTSGDICDERSCSIFEDGISAETIFPGLIKLQLVKLNVEQNCKSFFQFTLDEDGSVRGSGLPKVIFLDLVDSNFPVNPDSNLISSFFPNIRVLRMSYHDIRNLKNSFWVSFPFVEIIEMSDHPIYALDDNNTVSLVDKFFTGFPLELCHKLLITELPQFMNNPEGLKFLRVLPSICDLRYLKEFKLKFSSKLWFTFLSHVTGAYAFVHMPSTKFTISYNAKHYEDADDSELYFGPIRPFVHIVQEN